MHPSVLKASRRFPHAFSLLELLLAILISSLLMAGLTSAILIATRSLATSSNPAAETAQAADRAGEIIADLNVATSFTERTSTAATFTVPDRNGDQSPETIRYAWSGAGTPLTRQYNGGPIVALLPQVERFNLAYLTRGIGPSESAEQLLMSHDDHPSGSFAGATISPNDWAAQYFQPTLPANTISWKVTRVRLRMRRDKLADGFIGIEIRSADGNKKPSTEVLGQASLWEIDLPSDDSYVWKEFSFSYPSLAGLSPSSGLCIVVLHKFGSGNSCISQYETSKNQALTPNTHWMRSWDGGVTWTAPNDTQDMRFFVYGTITTE